MEIGQKYTKLSNYLNTLHLVWCTIPDQLAHSILQYRQSHNGKFPESITISEVCAQKILQDMIHIPEVVKKIELHDYSDLTFQGVPVSVQPMENL